MAITDLLTVDGFDYDKVAEYIDGTELNALAKAAAKTLLDQARDNPEGLQATLDGLKEALGL